METQNLTPALDRLRLRESPPPLLTLPDQNPKPNPNPNPNQNPSSDPRLRPSKSTAFKREERRRRKERKRQQRLQTLLDHPPPSAPPDPTVSDLPWPCDPTPSSPPTPTTAWPPAAAAAVASAAAAAPSPSAAAHAGALRASRAFFAESNGEGEGEDDDSEGEGEAMGGGAARGFFKGLFARDGELREYYEREWPRGEFRCLVCEGVGARAGKRFGGCAALVQHAAAVARTRARRPHRAFGSVVRRVLGWDDLQVDSCEEVASNEDEFAATAMET